MVTFPTKTSSMVKKLQICYSFVISLKKQCLCYLFYKWWKPHFLISKRVFRRFLLNYTDFAHKLSHIKPSKYDSTFSTKISICLKKVGDEAVDWNKHLKWYFLQYFWYILCCKFLVHCIQDTVHLTRKYLIIVEL